MVDNTNTFLTTEKELLGVIFLKIHPRREISQNFWGKNMKKLKREQCTRKGS
jgi:hypothetical protein